MGCRHPIRSVCDVVVAYLMALRFVALADLAEPVTTSFANLSELARSLAAFATFQGVRFYLHSGLSNLSDGMEF